MANGQYINIKYPFKDSKKGFYLDVNEDDKGAIKSDLMHLILTRRGQRLYLPDFGTELLRFIFEPNDSLTLEGIREEIKKVTKIYLPNLTLKDITIEPSPESEYSAVVTIDYVINDGEIFEINDNIQITL